MKPISNETEYRAALARVEQLMNTTQAGTPEREELMALADAVEAYEDIHYPLGPKAIAKEREPVSA